MKVDILTQLFPKVFILKGESALFNSKGER